MAPCTIFSKFAQVLAQVWQGKLPSFNFEAFGEIGKFVEC